MSNQSKQHIQQAIQQFSQGSLRENSLHLLAALGYESERQIEVGNTPEAFLEAFDNKGDGLRERDKALLADWQTVDVLCQITDGEIHQSNQMILLDSAGKVIDNAIIESYLFMAIGLKGETYTRTDLAHITREVNKLFTMPVMILFQHGQTLTLSIINRRLHKRESSKDVLEKVTLIKDIRIANPHRAHVEILFDLSLAELYRAHSFSNFVELHKAWQKTLDSSELNKKFFKEIANWYFWAVNEVVFPPEAGPDETRNATSVIRLITRLIFVWFLKEKGLVPDDLFNKPKLDDLLLWEDFNDSTYYKAILQNLFFATLNQEMNTATKADNRKFRGTRESGQSQHFMIHNVYRYEDYFQNPTAALVLFADIPFLNGGLFECLDKQVEGKTVRVDGFSDRTDNPLRVPDVLFWGDEQQIDLNETYGTSGKGYKVRGLIETLNRYKFTITENTPIEEEIALDPELLGKVFENLLAAYNPETGTTARKQTGSFYTPREIVNYMVDESLLAYFATKLERNLISLEERLRHLFAYNEEKPLFDPAEKSLLIDAIDHVNILDPACGSGAFPMGILHKLVFVLGKLDPHNEGWRTVQRQKALADTEEAFKLGDKQERQERLLQINDIFERNASDYGRKLYLIENCIYGVDIQPVAVQIAKLRFFISLVVDQHIDDTAANRGILPLPNLETKFVAANTLLRITDKKAGMAATISFGDYAVAALRVKLAGVRHRMFIARTQATKKILREQDTNLREQLAKEMRNNGWDAGATNRLAAWDPYDQNDSADFFDSEWMFGFDNGFDVIIGNPPYIRVQALPSELKNALQKRYRSTVSNYDIYVVFVEWGLDLLNATGQLSYILPHTFFNTKYGEGLRKIIAEGKHLRQVVHFGGNQIFEGASNYTCLLFLQKSPGEEFDFVQVDDLNLWLEHQEAPYEEISLSKVDQGTWNFMIGKAGSILDRLYEIPTKLEDVTARIFQGLKTSADKVFIVEEVDRQENEVLVYSSQNNKEYWLETDLLHPLIKGGDSEAYYFKDTNRLIIFPYQSHLNDKVSLIDPELLNSKWPKTWSYLMTNKTILEERERGKFKGSMWYAYGRSQALEVISHPKIFTPDIATKSSFSLDDNGRLFFTGGVSGGYGILSNSKCSDRYLLALLNSKITTWFIKQTATQMRGGYYSFESRFIKHLPIRLLDLDEPADRQIHRQIESLVEIVIYLKSQPFYESNDLKHAGDRLMVQFFEQTLDALIYEIYFPDEISSGGQYLSSILAREKFVILEEITNEPVIFLKNLFNQWFNSNHPIRKHLFFLDNVPIIREIEEKQK